MALQETLPPPAQRGDVRRPFAPLGCAVLAVLVGLWAYRAFHDGSARDSALAYVGGQIAWSTGHPEQWFSWTGTPFYAAVMAATSRAMSSATAARALTALNALLVVGTSAVVLRRLRGVLRHVWWWVLALALATYAPMMST